MSIPHTVEDDLKVITPETLGKIAPAALASLEEEDSDIIWYMDKRPQLITPADETEYGREEWTETNEPELAEWLAEVWDSVAVDVGGQRIVILAGTADDEYGKFWDNANQVWSSYMF